jgi:L-tartrate/succinate antiporter
LTGLAPNLLALSLVKQTAKIDITWIDWFMGILPVGAVLFILLPYNRLQDLSAGSEEQP